MTIKTDYEIIQVKIRMPRDLHKRLSREAEQMGLTVNSIVLMRMFHPQFQSHSGSAEVQ